MLDPSSRPEHAYMEHADASAHSTSATVAKSFLAPEQSWPGDAVEQERLHAIANLGLFEVERPPVFEEATQTAAHLLDMPMCILGILEQDYHRFKSAFGLSRLGLMNELATSRQILRSESLCDQIIRSQKVLAIADTAQEPSLQNMRLVRDYGIRAYLGVPFKTSRGQCIGTLAVMDRAPRDFSSRDIEMLELVARWCMSEYERTCLPFSADIASESDASNPLSQVKADLISYMAQELRTPLTSILGMASVLNREIYGPLTSKQKEYMDIIHSSGQQLLSVLNEMLDLGALDEKHQSLDLSAVDVEMACQQALNMLQPAADRRSQDLRLTVGLSANDRIWTLDKEKLRRMVYHLVLSVIQSASADSTIRVHLTTRQDSLNIGVWPSHQWLGDGLPYSEVVAHQFIVPGDKEPVTWAGDRSLSLSGNTPDLAPSSPSPKTDLTQPTPRLSRQTLELMLSHQLAYLQRGKVTLVGSPESGYRYVVTLPKATSTPLSEA